jgi:hypothetical protein
MGRWKQLSADVAQAQIDTGQPGYFRHRFGELCEIDRHIFLSG